MKLETLAKKLLLSLNQDLTAEGLKNTPKRFAKTLRFLTSGQNQSLKKVIGKGIFSTSSPGDIFIKNIDFYSLCEHHILPFFGQVHVAYTPQKKILGLSKIPRLIQCYSRRLQIQERLTQNIAHAMQEVIQAQQVAVIIEAQHLCMTMRGVKTHRARTITQCLAFPHKHTGLLEKLLVHLQTF